MVFFKFFYYLCKPRQAMSSYTAGAELRARCNGAWLPLCAVRWDARLGEPVQVDSPIRLTLRLKALGLSTSRKYIPFQKFWFQMFVNLRPYTWAPPRRCCLPPERRGCLSSDRTGWSDDTRSRARTALATSPR